MVDTLVLVAVADDVLGFDVVVDFATDGLVELGDFDEVVEEALEVLADVEAVLFAAVDDFAAFEGADDPVFAAEDVVERT